jgi:T5orf172 domain
MMTEKRRQKWQDLSPRSLIWVRDKLCVARGFIYVFPAQKLLKIGMTEFSIYRRWHSIKTSNPWLEPPLYVSPPLMERVGTLEKECHAALAEYRKSGEWFECERDLAVATVKRIVE